MKQKRTKAEEPTGPLGVRSDDIAQVRRALDQLGWSQTRLAEETRLSQPMINAFLNGKRKLSVAATDRVLSALRIATLEHKAAAELQNAYGGYTDVHRAVRPKDARTERDLFIGLAGPPPRDSAAYEEWKTRQVEIFTAAGELPAAKARIAGLEHELAVSQERVSFLEQIKANSDEIMGLYQGLIERLKKQIRDAGMTPVG